MELSGRIAAVLGVILVAGAATAVGLSASHTRAKAGARKAPCPRLMSRRVLSPKTPEAVLRAARSQIPRAYRGRWVNQPGVVVLKPESKYVVTGELSLSGDSETGGLARVRRDAVRKCGEAVANASWAVTF